MASATDTGVSERGAEAKAARRSRVIEAAIFMADEGGYDAVQMRAVAERAGVSLGTIYRYFKGKDDLLLAGLVGWVTRVRRDLEQRPSEGIGVEERLSAALGYAARAAEGSPVLMGALVTALSTTDAAAAPYKLQIDEEVGALIRAAIGDEPSLDADGVTRVVGHVWNSAVNRWVGGLAEAGSVEEELRFAVSMLVGPGAATSEDGEIQLASSTWSNAAGSLGSEKRNPSA